MYACENEGAVAIYSYSYSCRHDERERRRKGIGEIVELAIAGYCQARCQLVS